MGGESGKRSEGRRRHSWRAMSRRRERSTPLAAPRWSEGRREGFWDRLLVRQQQPGTGHVAARSRANPDTVAEPMVVLNIDKTPSFQLLMLLFPILIVDRRVIPFLRFTAQPGRHRTKVVTVRAVAWSPSGRRAGCRHGTGRCDRPGVPSGRPPVPIGAGVRRLQVQHHRCHRRARWVAEP